MGPFVAVEHQWEYLLAVLPKTVDLDESARQTGALTRKREISSAADLLRIVFVYALCGLPLRQTAAWAEAARVASLSNVAVLKRLQKCDKWLGLLLGCKLAERAPPPFPRLRVRLVDATTISPPGATGTSWRVHLGYDLQRSCIDHIELTDFKGGETLKRFRIAPDEIVLGDRGYSHRQGIHSVVESGGRYVIRHNWQVVPLGGGFDLFSWLRHLPDAAASEEEVIVAADRTGKIPELPARLVAIRKSESAAAEARQKLLRSRNKKGRGVNPLALEAAGYVCVLTNAPAELLSSVDVLDLYRFRWQIEMAFKRFEGLLHLGDLPSKDPPLSRTYLYAKLLGALMLEDLTERFLDFSPWGFSLR